MSFKYLSGIFIVLLLFLSGCGIEANLTKASEAGDMEVKTDSEDLQPTIYETVNDFEGVTMIAKEGTVSPTGMTVIFENQSNKQCVYGEDYLLEQKINGNWYQVPITFEGNYGFNDIGYELSPSDVQEFTVDWNWLYGELDQGEYRLVKSILDFRKSGDYDQYNLVAEFTID